MDFPDAHNQELTILMSRNATGTDFKKDIGLLHLNHYCRIKRNENNCWRIFKITNQSNNEDAMDLRCGMSHPVHVLYHCVRFESAGRLANLV